jgi:prepilin-type N-terminal cleavage/methylation domain-containing protein
MKTSGNVKNYHGGGYRKNSHSGFTLVEVIVVLVILAILAAIAIPALTGYIQKAKDRALISEGREIHVALQTMMTEQYAEGIPLPPDNSAQSMNSGSYFGLQFGVYYIPTNKAITELRALTGNNDIVRFDDAWSTTNKLLGNLGVIYIDGTEIVGFACVSDNNQKRLIYDKDGAHYAGDSSFTKIAKDWYVFPAR